MRLPSILTKIIRNDTGTSSVEYGFILAFIVLVMLVALQVVADATNTMWGSVLTKSSEAIAKNQG